MILIEVIFMNTKIDLLRKTMKKEGIDQLIISDFYNLVYFANVRIHAGERLLALLVNPVGENYLFVNELFTAKESDDYTIVYFNDTEDSVSVVSKYVNGKTVAIDSNWTAGFLLRLMGFVEAKYVNGSALMIHQRSIKDADEQKKMVQASLDNDAVMEKIVPFIKLGVTEKQIYNKLIELFTEQTGGPVSFDAIVGFGANAADPHHVSDDTVLQKGDAVLIDMGCQSCGYCSDMTRTFLQKDSKAWEIYDIVKNANIEAEKAIKPGMMYKEIDAVARNYISERGYGQYFTHRLGHGIGLEVHEGYDVSAVDEVIVEEGMCFSIEPGIYIPGYAGVRIEDLVIVQKDGAQVLNHFPKDPIILDL